MRDTGDPIGEAYALYGLGIVRHREGRLDNAETTQLQALTLATRVGELPEGQKGVESPASPPSPRGEVGFVVVSLGIVSLTIPTMKQMGI